MAYRVDLAKSAESQLEELYLWVMERAPTRGAAWYNGLEHAIFWLDQHPERCSIVPENIDPDSPTRILRTVVAPQARPLACDPLNDLFVLIVAAHSSVCAYAARSGR